MIRSSIRYECDGRMFRIMDYIRTDDGTEYLEVKNGHFRHQIRLDDLVRQVKEIKHNEMLPSHGSAK